MYKVIGIDEAGKGPVLGSMFIGFSIIVLAEGLQSLNSYQEKLVEIGVKDSKLLTPKKRNELYNQLKEMMDAKYAQLTPVIIDTNNSNGGKLHALQIEAITKILNEEKPDLVIIDAFTSTPEKFGEDLLKKLDFEPKIISENKADSKYSIVGAASIFAKELREQELAEIKKNIEIDCGSGYCGDPKTRKFVEEHGHREDIRFLFRKSWKTYKELAKGIEKQRSLDEF
jgi:ribonuclease HII